MSKDLWLALLIAFLLEALGHCVTKPRRPHPIVCYISGVFLFMVPMLIVVPFEDWLKLMAFPAAGGLAVVATYAWDKFWHGLGLEKVMRRLVRGSE